MDGDSGILDNSREIKMRIKAFAYAYRMSNDTKWVDRAWAELQVRTDVEDMTLVDSPLERRGQRYHLLRSRRRQVELCPLP